MINQAISENPPADLTVEDLDWQREKRSELMIQPFAGFPFVAPVNQSKESQ